MNKYWFTEEAKTVVNRLQDSNYLWYNYGTNPVAQAWLRNSLAYYSCMLEPSTWSSALSYQGDQGELVKMVIPLARNVIRQIVTLATKKRLNFKVICEKSDYEMMQVAKFGDSLAQDIVKTQQLDQKRGRVIESACVMGAGYYKASWRTDLGDQYGTDEQGNVIYTGGLEVSSVSVYDVVYDSRVENWKDLQWVQVRVQRNRWDLIAQYPELETEILALPNIYEATDYRTFQRISASNEDVVWAYEVYHKPTAAVRQGRMIMYSNPETVYFDGANRYGCIPVVQVKPEGIMQLGFGYPLLSSLLPAQEMLDHSYSAVATNQAALAVQSVLCPRDAGISVSSVGGMNWIMYTPQQVEGGGKPEAMQLSQSAPETFKFAEMLEGKISELGNLNQAIRGNPPAGASGTMVATLVANAMEFQDSLSNCDQLALEELMELCFGIFESFASVPQKYTVYGKNSQASKKTFVGKDLSNIMGIKMTTINPMMQTIGGRIDLADKLMQAGMITDVKKYFSVLEGAPEATLYDVELSQEDLIMSENDNLADGEPVQALATDDHAQHVHCHSKLMNDPIIRMNSLMIEGVLAHIEEHVNLAKQTDPFLMAMVMTGKQPQQQMPTPGGEQGAPSSGGGSDGPAPVENQPAQPAQDQAER